MCHVPLLVTAAGSFHGVDVTMGGTEPRLLSKEGMMSSLVTGKIVDVDRRMGGSVPALTTSGNPWSPPPH